jgi:hypothetical protein
MAQVVDIGKAEFQQILVLHFMRFAIPLRQTREIVQNRYPYWDGSKIDRLLEHVEKLGYLEKVKTPDGGAAWEVTDSGYRYAMQPSYPATMRSVFDRCANPRAAVGLKP